MNLIILAAGKGSRIADLTKGHPKHLFKIHGMPIIERIIENLGHNFEKINIVTGYRSDEFEYLKDKYEKVSLSYNKNWETTETKGSFLVGWEALEEQKGCYLINGDSYIFERIDLVEPSETMFHYSINDEKDEWVLELKGNRVSKIDVHGLKTHNKLLELYYLDKETVGKVKKINDPNLFLSIMKTGANPIATELPDIKDIDTHADVKYVLGIEEKFIISPKNVKHAVYKATGINTKDFELQNEYTNDLTILINNKKIIVKDYLKYSYEEFKECVRREYGE